MSLSTELDDPERVETSVAAPTSSTTDDACDTSWLVRGPTTALDPDHRRRRRRTALLVLAAYLGLAVAFMHGVWASPSTRVAGYCCDQFSSVMWLYWTGHSVLHAHSPLLNAYVNAPTGVNAMWDAQFQPVLSLLATPFELVLGPLTTYNLVLVLEIAASGWSAFLALRRWVGGTVGPFVGGLLFGFSPLVMISVGLGHDHASFVALVPPTLVVLVDLLCGRSRSPVRASLLFGALLALQLLCGEEAFTGLLLSCLVLTVAMVATRRHLLAPLHQLARLPLWSALSFLVIAGVPLFEQFGGPLRLTNPDVNTASAADLGNFVAPGSFMWWHPDWLADLTARWTVDVGNQGVMYVGLPLLVVCVVTAVVLRRRLMVLPAAVLGAAMAVCSLGSQLHVAGYDTGIALPWTLLSHLPLLRFAYPTRLTAGMWFGVAVLVAEATRAAVGSLRGQLPRWHRGMAVGLLALVTLGMAAIAPAWAMGVTPVPVPAFFTSPALDSHVPAGALVYLVPLPTAGAGYDSATWQVVAGMRFRITGGNLVVRGPGGAGERSPGATGPLADAVTSIEAGGAAPSPEDLPALRRALARTGATVVLVGPMPQEAAEIDFMTSLLGRAPHRVGGVALWSIPAPRTTGGPVPH